MKYLLSIDNQLFAYNSLLILRCHLIENKAKEYEIFKKDILTTKESYSKITLEDALKEDAA